AAVGAVPHVHLWLLGFPFSFPVPGNAPCGKLPLSETTFVATTPVAVCDSLASSDVATSLLAAMSSQVAALHNGLPPPGQTLATHRPQLLAAPLCDAARFERSGVQVI